ncbi:unnamed protein product [Arabidopsis thaliana]|uniref:Uncharacterized protein n=1 Tax=Arabidopsis thaliana TaxID=3702 RepID=A0A5S9WLY1_ARATH|nr:unnamed protein product [Arabidopsis thaliana]
MSHVSLHTCGSATVYTEEAVVDTKRHIPVAAVRKVVTEAVTEVTWERWW